MLRLALALASAILLGNAVRVVDEERCDKESKRQTDTPSGQHSLSQTEDADYAQATDYSSDYEASTSNRTNGKSKAGTVAWARPATISDTAQESKHQTETPSGTPSGQHSLSQTEDADYAQATDYSSDYEASTSNRTNGKSKAGSTSKTKSKSKREWPPPVEEQAEQETEHQQETAAHEEEEVRAIKNPQLAVREAMQRALDRADEREEKLHQEEDGRFADHPEHDMDHPNFQDYHEYALDHQTTDADYFITHRDDPTQVDPHEDPDADIHPMPGQENDHGYIGYQADYHFIDHEGSAEHIGEQHFGTGDGVGRRRSRRRFRRRRQVVFPGSSMLQNTDANEKAKRDDANDYYGSYGSDY